MIRTNNEYTQTVEQVADFRARAAARVTELKDMGLTDEQVTKVTEPEMAFYEQLDEEVKAYDRLRRQDESELNKYDKLQDLGKLLIALRIYGGMSQSQLAQRLGVDPSQVSRDEKNEYFGITLSRAQKVLEALGANPVSIHYEPMAVTPPSKKQEEIEYA